MNNFLSFLHILQINNLFKIGFLVVNFIFIVFLLILAKQIRTMNTIVSSANDATVIKSATLLLLVIAISLFLTALVIL
jgi:hypothetical protein